MPLAKHSEEETKHTHNWILNTQGEYYCRAPYMGHPCQAIGLSQEKFDYHCAEWRSYYDLCQTTVYARRYQQMRDAWREHDMEQVFVLINEAKAETTPFLEAPTTVDPFDAKSIYMIL